MSWPNKLKFCIMLQNIKVYKKNLILHGYLGSLNPYNRHGNCNMSDISNTDTSIKQ